MSIITNLLGSVLKLGITFVGKRRLPLTTGEFKLPGLSSPVTIIRDKWGIPHINASNDKDLFFAQGFIHAQDRLWQMELNRRTANGTLSEIFGEIALDTDKSARILGFNRIGKQDIKNLDTKVIEIFEAYTKGVNAHINSLETNLPVEFSLIKAKPELWKIEDSMALGRLMIWQLSHAWYGEIIRSKLIEAVGEEHAATLEIEYPEGNPSTLVSSNIQFNKIDKKGNLIAHDGPFIRQNAGSNGWVISGLKSITGKPILCNDMHLVLSLPSIWYQNHLKSKKLNITGVSIPGIPMVLVGHNDKIAWGMTLAFTDCEDLFVEKFNPKNPDQYKFKQKWLDADIITEEIKIKDKESHFEKVIITQHGPIISNTISDEQEKLSLNSMSLKPANSFNGWRLLNYAKNWDDFVKAVRNIEAPQLNVVYGDEKNIGYWCTGKVPIRKNGNGMLPANGFSGKYEWIDTVPFEKMPHSFNPKEGIIITTNNKIIPDDYEYYLGSVWMNGYRARRIEDYFNTLDKIGPDNCKTMQLDFKSLPGIEFINHYKELDVFDQDKNHNVKKAFEIMINWDGNLTADSIGGCLYEVSRYFVIREMLVPNLGEELTNTFMGKGFHPILLPSHEFYGHDTVVLLRNLNDPDSWWIKNAGGKTKLLQHGFNRAFEWLLDNVGTDINKWTWGNIHRVTFAHSMAIKKPMDRVFNRGNIPIGGDTDTTCQMAIIPEEPFSVKSWAPSVRFIIDMGDLTKSQSMYAPGQSGQIGSRHYSDLIDDWVAGNYFPMLWTRGQIEQYEKGRLILKS